MFFHRNVGPPVPGGYADQLREREEPVGRAAAVAARDDEGFADARQGIGDGLDQVTLPGAFERGGVDLPRFGQPADEGAASDRPDDYRRACFPGAEVTRGYRPVTASTSAAKSSAARFTTAASDAS